MARYRFVTTWRVRAAIEAVWDAIYHSERWPTWWKGVEQVTELQPGDKDGVGSVRRYVWKSTLPYRLVFDMRVTRVERPVVLDGEAFGELEGTGKWRLSHSDGVTTVEYVWDVRTTRAWMNFLAPIARPIFAWNHDVVMRWGGEGLARLLGAELTSGGGR
ncbi:MAG: SRPBCC family protein [Armatimonadetes bacterium]|nr:SRPBCC family protein [Armatimonadota bacterium]